MYSFIQRIYMAPAVEATRRFSQPSIGIYKDRYELLVYVLSKGVLLLYTDRISKGSTFQMQSDD